MKKRLGGVLLTFAPLALAAAEHRTPEAAFAAASRSGNPVLLWAFARWPEPDAPPWPTDVLDLMRGEFEYVILLAEQHPLLCQKAYLAPGIVAAFSPRGAYLGRKGHALGGGTPQDQCAFLKGWIPPAQDDAAYYARRIRTFLEGKKAAPAAPPAEDDGNWLGNALREAPIGPEESLEDVTLIRACAERFQLEDARAAAAKAVERGLLARGAADLLIGQGLCHTERFAEGEALLSPLARDGDDAELRGKATLWLAKLLFYKHWGREDGSRPAFEVLDGYIADARNPKARRDEALALRKAMEDPSAKDPATVLLGEE